MKRTALLLGLGLLLSLPARAQDVPPAYQALYTAIEAKLGSIEDEIAGHGDGAQPCLGFSADLLGANTTVQKTKLLNPAVQAFAFAMLDALDALGLNAVRLNIGYPILAPGFPDQAQYLDFYKRLAADVRARGMTLFIKANTVPSNPTYGFVDPVVAQYMDGLAAERYKTEKRQMIEVVLDELRPDYYTVENEPTTMRDAIGLPYEPEDQEAYVRYFLQGLDTHGAKMGAGVGSWEPLDYVQRLVDIPELDYIDLHVYPIYFDFAAGRLFAIDALADQKGKDLVLGEMWLYKTVPSEIGTPPLDIYKRDVFSFWQPLDARFVTSMVRFAQVAGADLVTFYWTPYLFGYYDYQPGDEALSSEALYAKAIPEANAAMLAGGTSSVGQAYRSLVNTACGTNTAAEQAPSGASMQLRTFPNPVQGAGTLEVEVPAAGRYAVVLYDLLGRRVQAWTLTARAPGTQRLALDLSALPAGLYVVQVGGGAGGQRARLLVKQ